MLQSNTPPVRNQAPLTARSSSLRCECVTEHHIAQQYPKTGRTKSPKASPKKRSIMEHSPGLPQDTKSLRSCSGNRAKILLKYHLRINITPNITRESKSLSIVPPIVNGGDCGCIVRDLETIIVLVTRTTAFLM